MPARRPRFPHTVTHLDRASPTALAPGPPAAVVLDTNVVLDWLVFDDPRVRSLAVAVRAGDARWLTCGRMRDEFARTLGYPALARRSPDVVRLLADFDRCAVSLPAPQAVADPGLCCSDPDDQVFVDLAIAHRARWLVTHDRAVLRLRRRAAGHGLRILRPGEWSAAAACAGDPATAGPA